MIVFSDNAAVLEVFDKPKAAIFAFLEEQCLIQTGKSVSLRATFMTGSPFSRVGSVSALFISGISAIPVFGQEAASRLQHRATRI